MIERCYYECEFCQELFDTEEECITHEIKHRCDEFKGQFHCYDINGIEMEYNNYTADEVYYFEVSSPAAMKLIHEIYNEYACVDSPMYVYEADYPVNFLYYSTENNKWENLTTEFNRLKEIENIFKKD